MAIADQGTLWLAAALLAGLLHLAIARALGLGFSVVRWGWESRDLAWRVPAGYVLVFAPVAVVLVLATLTLGWPRIARFTYWCWATLVAFALLLLFPQIHGYASLLLAGGLAWRLAPSLTRRDRAVRRVARWSGGGGAAALVLAIALVPGVRRAREASAVADLVRAPEGAANVLILILDTVRADYMSVYTPEETTSPKLAQLARSGVVFEQSYSTSSWTTPSHASLFTGHYPSDHGASFTTRLADRHLTLAEWLQSRGWATGGFTANFAATPIESGLAQGFGHYDDLKNSLEEVAKSTTLTQADNVLRFWYALQTGRGARSAVSRFFSTDFAPRLTEQAHDDKSAEEVRAQFTSWLDAIPPSRPFFAFLNFFDAHAPYRPPEPYVSMFGAPSTTNRYRGSIRYLDDQVDALVRDLEQRGRLENTILVITSDHGEQFGEHGQDTHANSLYRQVLHVPLILRFPARVPAGVRVPQQVTGRDVPATILELLGVPRDPAIGGTSLAPLWADSAARASDVVAEVDQNMRPVLRFRNSLGPMKAVFGDTLHVIRDGKGLFETYRYRVDPREEADLVAATGDSLPFARELQAVVRRHRLTWPPAVPPARPTTVDAETRDR